MKPTSAEPPVNAKLGIDISVFVRCLVMCLDHAPIVDDRTSASGKKTRYSALVNRLSFWEAQPESGEWRAYIFPYHLWRYAFIEFNICFTQATAVAALKALGAHSEHLYQNSSGRQTHRYCWWLPETTIIERRSNILDSNS